MATVVTRSVTRSVPSGGGPQSPSITSADIWAQFKIDIAGKEVQTAETTSHSWLANQFGHVAIGILLGNGLSVALERGWPLVLGWLNLPASWALPLPWDTVVGYLLATGGVAVWEWRAYRKEVSEAAGGFTLDRQLLRRNAITAASYMVLGVAVAVVFRYVALGPRVRWFGLSSVVWSASGFAVLASIAILIALPWLRQKIVWQKAALPFLFRLADAKPATAEDARMLDGLLNSSPPPDSSPTQVLICGPIGSGRTEIGTGIGTEFAFRNIAVRYLRLATLLEFAARSRGPDFFDDIGPANIVYWPWSRAQAVIIDDIGPVVAGKRQNHFEEFVHILRTQLDGIQAVLRQCHTIWIIGDPSGRGEMIDSALLDRYAREISDYCNGLESARQKVVIVQLEAAKAGELPKVVRARIRHV